LKQIDANLSKYFVLGWLCFKANILKRIFWNEFKRIEANICIWIFTNQSEYSPNKIQIRFDSLHSE
jgi:hypothetical protein